MDFKKECILFLLLLFLNEVSSLNEISLVIEKRKGDERGLEIIQKMFFKYISEVAVNGKSTTIDNYINLLNYKLNTIIIRFNQYLDSTYQMFFDTINIVSIDLSNFYTSNIKNSGAMFQYCVRLKSLKLNNFNTSLITNMGRMFYDLYSLESLDVSNFDTSSVTNMEKMFLIVLH